MIAEAVAWVRKEAVPLGFAVLLHAALGALLILGTGLGSARPRDMPGPGNEHRPIQAVAVSEKDYQAAQAEIAGVQQARERHAQALKQQAEQAESARKKAEQELARLKEENRRAATQAAQQKQNLQTLARQTEQTEQTKKQNEAEIAKLKAQAEAAEKARAAEEAKLKKAQAEAAAAKKAAAEAQAKAEARRKAQMQQEMAAEEDRRLSKARGNWVAAIRVKVEQNWNRPPSTPANLDCTIQITQLPNGQVTNAKMKQCNGDSVVQQSVITAIYKSSPLPQPDDPAVFQRQITFEFVPDQSQ